MNNKDEKENKFTAFQILILLVAGLMLGACNQTSKDVWKPKFEPPKAQVDLTEDNYFVSFADGATKPYLTDTEQLRRDFGDVRKDQVEKIVVLVPQQKFQNRAANLKQIIESEGFSANQITFLKQNEFVNEAVIQIHEWKASVDDCPNWDKPHGTDYHNSLGVNFGCATAQNLALMVDNPHDLEKGRSPSMARADQPVAAQMRYRSGEIIDINRAEGVLAGD